MAESSQGFVLHAAARILFTAGVPSYFSRTPALSPVIIDTGVGDITLTLAPGFGVDQADSIILATPKGALVASQLTTISVDTLTDFTFRVTILREGAAGAASALADIDFWIQFFKRVIT